MASQLPVTGGCLCRAIRFEARAEPLIVRQCWCRDCQYWGAGSSTVNVAFRTEDVAFTGELRIFSSTADSGNRMLRGFCPSCGTPVTTAAEARPHLVMVRGGTLDDASIVRPQLEIWTSSAPAWACLNPDIPHFAGQPPPAG